MSIKIVTSGGGLAGIILLGGALVTAALVSTFAYKRIQKSKKGDDDNCLIKCSKGGLSFLVRDCLSPQLTRDLRPSNGTEDDYVSRESMVLDDTKQVNGDKDEDIDILEKGRESPLCDESVTIMEDFPVQFADTSLLQKPEKLKKYDRFEKNSELKADEKILMANSDQVGVVCNGIKKNFDGNNKMDDLVEVVFKEHMPAEKCSENSEVIIEREEVLVKVPQSEQLGIDYDYQKRGDECDGILVEEREELVEAAVVNKIIRADNNPYQGGNECDADVGITIEKGEELVGGVAANGIQLSEKLDRDQGILCADGEIIQRNEDGTCDINKTSLLLVTDSSSLLKPASADLVEETLVIEDTKILEGDEADKISVQEDSIKVEDRVETQFVEPNEDCKIDRETTNDKWEGADEIGNDQQMQQCEEFQINEATKYSSDKSSPEMNSFQCDGLGVQEFSFPLLDSPPYCNFGNLIKDVYSQKALHVEDFNTMEKDKSANEVFSYQTMVERNPQSTNNDEMKSFNDGGENDVAKGEEILLTGLVDIGDGRKNDAEALEIIGTEDSELGNNQQPPLKEDNNYNDNVNEEEVSDSSEEEETSDSDCDEEDTGDEDEDISETSRGSSLASNAEAIWPVESVQELSRKIKPIQDNHNFMETEREDGHSNFNKHNLEEPEKNLKKEFSDKFTEEITTRRQATMFWFLSLLVPFLLLLWLLSSQLSSPDSSCCHMQ
ncbi:hypothetical protein DCAR_0314022 [Daucus carota subsp. sativus]|uniref:Uncharacterized protein n=2 Tax=Daucus carota subsp. sativus TaxID=79200 RepID=A0A166CDF0_DAUCS|nr:hypothetical protein DCAR_0314022 [Daucus carota subsp. sativus]